jgi:hypothetical protein
VKTLFFAVFVFFRIYGVFFGKSWVVFNKSWVFFDVFGPQITQINTDFYGQRSLY